MVKVVFNEAALAQFARSTLRNDLQARADAVFEAFRAVEPGIDCEVKDDTVTRGRGRRAYPRRRVAVVAYPRNPRQEQAATYALIHAAEAARGHGG